MQTHHPQRAPGLEAPILWMATSAGERSQADRFGCSNARVVVLDLSMRKGWTKATTFLVHTFLWRRLGSLARSAHLDRPCSGGLRLLQGGSERLSECTLSDPSPFMFYAFLAVPDTQEASDRGPKGQAQSGSKWAWNARQQQWKILAAARFVVCPHMDRPNCGCFGPLQRAFERLWAGHTAQLPVWTAPMAAVWATI